MLLDEISENGAVMIGEKDETEENGLDIIFKDGITLLVKSWNRDSDIMTLPVNLIIAIQF